MEFGTTQLSFVVPDADVVAGWLEGVPGDVEPGAAGEELVGVFPRLQEIDKVFELSRIFRDITKESRL